LRKVKGLSLVLHLIEKRKRNKTKELLK